MATQYYLSSAKHCDVVDRTDVYSQAQDFRRWCFSSLAWPFLRSTANLSFSGLEFEASYCACFPAGLYCCWSLQLHSSCRLAFAFACHGHSFEHTDFLRCCCRVASKFKRHAAMAPAAVQITSDDKVKWNARRGNGTWTSWKRSREMTMKATTDL